MSGSTVSRRVSEFVGVALFAAALIWIISLASYEPADPVWFFSTGAHARAGELRRARRRVPRRAVVPAVRLRLVPRSRRSSSSIGWHYFWCRTLDAAGHQGDRRGAALRLRQRVPQPGVRHARGLGQGVPRRRLRSASGSRRELPEYLNRTGLDHRHPHADLPGDHPVDAVLVRPRCSRRCSARSRAGGAERLRRRCREWREERRREKQRREVIAKHTKKAGADAAAVDGDGRRRREGRAASGDVDATPDDSRRRGRTRPPPGRSRRRRPPRRSAMPAPPLPLADPEPTTKAPAERRGRLHAAAARAARRAEDRAEDRRARADGRRAPARGEVPRVLGRRQRRPDPPGPGRHDVRVQAGRRREVHARSPASPTTSASRCRPSRC